MNNDFNQSTRSTYRAKRKKTNLVLNSLIILVLALIIIVAYNIFVGGDDSEKGSSKAATSTQTEKQDSVKESKPKEEAANKGEKTKDSDAKDDKSNGNAAVEEDEQTEEASANEQADEQAVVSDGGSSSNVLKTIVNPGWEPVGTSQSGPHTTAYDSKSVDWQEMLNAITYATGLDPSNMTVYWLGRDKTTTDASIGTVASKDKQQKYNVYIKWVDGEGWVPTKVEEIAEIVKP